MILRIYTIFHVIISLLGIFSGFVVIYGLHTADPLNGWTAFFLATTVATSVTGFFFPFQRLMPSHIVGIIFAGRARAGHLRALLRTPRWGVALDLCGGCRARAVSELLRPHRAMLPKNITAESTGPDAERAAVRGDTTLLFDRVRRAGRGGGH
jgi:hypothetical protein